jgi:hypothetical protein
MHVDCVLDDVILFAFLDLHDAQRLSAHVDRWWAVWLESRDGTWLVGVELRPTPDDLALLLRSVETWVVERRLRSLPFYLDGRVYRLAPARRVATGGRARLRAGG